MNLFILVNHPLSCSPPVFSSTLSLKHSSAKAHLIGVIC